MEKRNFIRRTELDYINAIACLLVILIHVLSYGIGGTDDPQFLQAAVIYFPWRLAGFVVPVFLFTGAVKMALFFENAAITAGVYVRYIWERIRHIFLPYVVWVVIYYLCFYAIGYVQGTPYELIAGIFLGNLSGQFYYIVIVMQFYLLMPLWMRMIRKIPFFAAFFISLFVTMTALRTSNILSWAGIVFGYSDRLFLPYTVFWVLGMYAGADYNRISERMKRLGAGTGLILCLCVLTGALLSYINYSRRISLLDLECLKLVTDIMSIILIWAFCLRIRGRAAHAENILTKIAGASYQVYLSHCLFLTMGTAIMEGYLFGTKEILLMRLAAGYTVPFVLYDVLEKIKKAVREK